MASSTLKGNGTRGIRDRFNSGLVLGTLPGSGKGIPIQRLTTAQVATVIANSGAIPLPSQISSAALDAVFGSTEGNILQRGPSVWQVLAPGTNGQVLTSQGAAALNKWAAASGGTTLSDAGAWSGVSAYTVGQCVQYNGIAYLNYVAISAPVVTGDIHWSATDKDAAITLDAPHLIATQNSAASAWRSIRGITGHLLGGADLVYFEVQVTAKDPNTGWVVGVGDATANISNYAGSDNHAIGYQPTLSTVYINGGFSGNSGLNPGNVNDWWGFAVNCATSKIWAVNVTNDPTHSFGSAGSRPFSDIAGGLNGGSLGGMTGNVFPMWSGQDNGGTDSCTLDTKGTHGTIPAGYSAWGLGVAVNNPPPDQDFAHWVGVEIPKDYITSHALLGGL